MMNFKHIVSWSLFENVYQNSSGDHYWGDQGAGILPIAQSTGRILVAHRSKHVNEPNTYGIWGGKLDDGETDPEEAAKRELEEEAGYKGHFKLIPAYVFKTPNNTFEYHNFIGIVDKEFEPKFDWETQGAKWMTFEEFKNLKNKHWGLQMLLDNSADLIKKYSK